MIFWSLYTKIRPPPPYILQKLVQILSFNSPFYLGVFWSVKKISNPFDVTMIVTPIQHLSPSLVF